MVRILSIWFPRLPLDRRVRLGDPRVDDVFAVTTKVKSVACLAHLSPSALEAGLMPGLSIADARAICPALLTEPCDTLREAALLRALWRWADQLSPRVALDEPDGLLLNISGCAHLFGGEEAMGAHARQRLHDMQIDARIGIGDTKGSARAMARFGKNPVAMAQPGDTRAALEPLPIAALDVPGRTAAELAQSGLRTIGQLYRITPSELTRRFGLDLATALGASIGQVPDPVMPAAADPIYAARMTLPEPVGYVHDMKDALQRLAGSVCGRLQEAQKGARRFELTVRCVDAEDHVLSVGFACPCFEAGQVLQQFAHSLDQLEVDFGADWFRLAAFDVEPVGMHRTGLGKPTDSADGMARTISTIGNRLGFDHVRRFRPIESHLPEREFDTVEAVSKDAEPVWLAGSPRQRPLRLYGRPERLRTLEPGRPPVTFEWRRTIYHADSTRGPERLTSEWWCEGDKRLRDYWTVQTTNGPRLWLLTYPGNPASDWYVAGTFP